MYNMEAIEKAARNLDAGAFKLWCYLAKNQDGYVFSLSSKHARESFGLKSSQYNEAVSKLKEGNYLVSRSKTKSEKGGYWYFKDIPEEIEDAISHENPSGKRESPCIETEQDLHGSMTSPQDEALKEAERAASENEQGLHGNDASTCIETDRALIEKDTRNNIDRINNIDIGYRANGEEEDSKKLYLGEKETIPYSRKALSSDEYIEAITSVPRNYCTVKEALGNGDIPDDLKAVYKAYLSNVDSGCIGGLMSIF